MHEAIEDVQTVIRQEARDRMRVIGDTINEAQQGMDLAFAAGTLSTAAGVSREDSLRYAERSNIEDTERAMSEAKVSLKRALEKSSVLRKDNYEQVKQWLKKDEDTLILTIGFLHKMRQEIKRSLKLTVEKIKQKKSDSNCLKKDATVKMFSCDLCGDKFEEESKLRFHSALHSVFAQLSEATDTNQFVIQSRYSYV